MPKPTIAICTLFRDCEDDVERIFNNRSKFTYDKNKILNICVEGDSIDGTNSAIMKAASKHRVELIKFDLNRPKFGSVIEPERLINLAKSWNLALDFAVNYKIDYVFIVDSDIIVTPSMFERLISLNFDVVAPMMFFDNSVYFRDTWAYIGLNGELFTNRPKYHLDYVRNKPFSVNSVGLPFMKRRVLELGARCDDNEVVGLCSQIKKSGNSIYVDPLSVTYHPRMNINVPAVYDTTGRL